MNLAHAIRSSCIKFTTKKRKNVCCSKLLRSMSKSKFIHFSFKDDKFCKVFVRLDFFVTFFINGKK